MYSRHRRGVITSITAMILIIASVILGTGLVTFSTSIFKTGSQQQSIAIQNIEIWVNPADPRGVTWGAAGIKNNGDMIVPVDKIQVRDKSIPFTNWYVENNQSAVTTANFQAQYEVPSTDNTGMMKSDLSLSPNSQCGNVSTNIKIDFDGGTGPNPMLCLQQAAGPIELNPGQKMIVYFRIPNGVIDTIDMGSSATVGIFARTAGAPLQVSIGSTNQQSNSNSNILTTFVFLVRTGFPDEPSLISLYHKHARSTDIVVQFSNALLDSSVTSQISSEEATNYFSISDIQNNAAILRSDGYAWIVYDLESSYSPANEVADPVGSVQQAAQIAHANGLKLMITSDSVSMQNMPTIASYTDGYVLQEQNYINGNLTTFTHITQDRINQIKAGNPSEIIILQGSTTIDTTDQINAAYDLTKNMVNGITVFYNNDVNDIPKIAQVLTHIDGIS